ncbi:argininosuccinate synthase [Marinoscillum furvescens]|uniref:argininosuccinate synthase n=1 Tax=Marinoscillum furvescens DSM 4134 TaxID=1122208 RepID=A0A3D9KX32_MARFU|nr:argininosuccinate synthase [Marinoscillum furvescens]RED93197.1 argininosuccinate synthase [Marinoscillum furvescens DSM 4134]
MSKQQKVVLAFSGGLDTTYCTIYLKELGYEVHTVSVNTGGFDADELKELEEKSKALGGVSHLNIDATEEFYQKSIKYLIAGNVLKNNTYPLSVSAERVFQATAIANHAIKIGADAIAHGSTGAGNDQVRFDMIFNILCPEKGIITPIRDNKLSREEEIQYLIDHGVSGNWEKALYSVNQGLWGTSVGGKETLTSNEYLAEEAFPSQLKQEQPKEVSVTFEKGEPVAFNGEKMAPVACIEALNAVASAYAIGRDIHVGDTIIGIKGRVGFEAAAPVILIKAHHTLEKHVLTKNQLTIKDQLSITYGNLLHEGHYLDPIMRDIEQFYESTQEYVSGTVKIQLAPYRFYIIGVESAHDLMQSTFGKYGEMNNSWSGEDVKGFSKIFGNQNMIYHKVHQTDG